jgi:phage tail-like protein
VDANGSRFHLLLGRDDWAQCSVKGIPLHEVWEASTAKPGAGELSWQAELHELRLQERLLRFVAAPKDTFPSISNRRGAAADCYGNWYWIDESEKKIRVLSSGTGVTTEFWPMPQSGQCGQAKQCGTQPRAQAKHGDFQPLQPETSATLLLSGLVVTEDHYLVVGVLNPGSLLIFDLHAGGEPRQLLWPENVPFAPFDMTAMPGGGVAILDRQLDRQQPCYWVLDRNFNVLGPKDKETPLQAQTEDFQPLDGSSVRGREPSSFAASIALFSSPVGLRNPIAIEALSDGTVLILDHDLGQRFSRIYHYHFEKQLPDELTTEAILGLIEEEFKSTVSLVGYDIAFVPRHDEDGETIPDRLYVAAADGNQSFAFRVCLRQNKLELQPIAEYLPMRLFGGKGLVASGAGVYYDFNDSWIPLVKQRRPRYVSEATLESPIFDGLEPNCVWHRLMIDAFIPPETKVEVWSRAADERKDLPLLQWQPEPPLYLRGDGSELPFLRSMKICNGRSPKKKDGDGTWELLFQRARGRFLQIRLRLSGNERSTPRLRALRSYYPRFSYLVNYLPGVYREDDQSASFLDRFLANMEGFYTTLEDKIAAAQVLFDVRSAPAETLEWLASWFGVALDPNWDERRRRLFIRHAMDFFQYRGTARGLTMALHLALDSCVDESIFVDDPKRRQGIRIVEKYLTRTMPGVIFGDPTGTEGLRTVVPRARWQPDQGRANLNQRYTEFINPSAPANQLLIPYPIIPPTDEAKAARWQQFSQETLGFVSWSSAADRSAWQVFLGARYGNINSLNSNHQTSYSGFDEIPLPADLPANSTTQKDWLDFVSNANPAATPVERLLWQDFLARRYRRSNSLNDAYGTRWTSFDVVSLPDELPRDGAALRDWYQFEGIVMQMQRTAHRFTVLLPVPVSLAFSPEEHQLRMDLSRRVIELEKPAHTVFDVKFYWAIFRVGEARLQLDTLMDQGSRAPQLLPRLILGQGFVGQGYLAPPAPEEATNRLILGRDSLRNDPHEEERS